VVADWTGIPIGRMVRDDAQSVLKLGEILSARVVAQPDALETISRRIRTARARLDNPNKPVGVVLLCGPSGVGKTETALALSEALYGGEQNLVTINMSEFQESHTVSTLKGAPPGYVGYGEGGVLTEAVRRRPYGVLLLDEMEKAHPDVYNILLQVMDNGKLTDHNGRTVDFRNVVLIMTSNAGASEQAKEALGFGRNRREGEDTAAVERMFTPEFRNRLDAVISFAPLPREVILQVVEKFVLQLEAQLLDRNVQIELSPEAAEWLAEKGYDDKMGARPLGRVIQENIKKPLAEELLFGKLAKGGLVRVAVVNDEISLEIQPAATLRIATKKPPLLTAE
jgi:ATP-dependent Clp protease ATP-binding subunit ClpA